MRPLRRIAAGAAAALAFAAVLPAQTAGADATCWDYKHAEKRFARKINRVRNARDKRKLSLDPEISKVARVHSRKMLKDNALYHSRNLGSHVTNWSVLGENVGVGGGVTQLHKAFMKSEAHKDNILYGSFKHVGVGVARSDGVMWVTVVFEGKQDPGTTLKMPDC